MTASSAPPEIEKSVKDFLAQMGTLFPDVEVTVEYRYMISPNLRKWRWMSNKKKGVVNGT